MTSSQDSQRHPADASAPIVESVHHTAPDHRSAQQQTSQQQTEPRQASPEQVDQVIASALPLTGVIPVVEAS